MASVKKRAGGREGTVKEIVFQRGHADKHRIY